MRHNPETCSRDEAFRLDLSGPGSSLALSEYRTEVTASWPRYLDEITNRRDMQLLHTRFSLRSCYLQTSTLRYCSSYLFIDYTNRVAGKLKLIYSPKNTVKCVGYRF